MIPDSLAADIPNRELVLTRLIDSKPDKLFRAWTETELLKRWIVPKPWTIAHAETDVRPGSSSLIVIRAPEGNEYPNRGVYLDVVGNRQIVFTDAYVNSWEPSEKPFMTAEITIDPEDSKTSYAARVRHWTIEDREAHEKIGFHHDWGICADQLAELVREI